MWASSLKPLKSFEKNYEISKNEEAEGYAYKQLYTFA
jgi:hypothetical protein